VRGDVELHLVASGWRAHGHHVDPAYARVVLHVVGANDSRALTTAHAGGRAVPMLVLRAQPRASFPPPFTPPCALASARGANPQAALARLGARRMRIKTVRVAALLGAVPPGQALYLLLLETLAGSANRAAFRVARAAAAAGRAARARGWERGRASAGDGGGAARRRGAARPAPWPACGPWLRPRAGSKPPARSSPGSGPPGSAPGWPSTLAPDPGVEALPLLRAPGVGRAMAIELLVNAVLPIAGASGEWSDARVAAAYVKTPSPGTYGRLRPLERWLGAGGSRPFAARWRSRAGCCCTATTAPKAPAGGAR